jgi:hypothetical protein
MDHAAKQVHWQVSDFDIRISDLGAVGWNSEVKQRLEARTCVQ